MAAALGKRLLDQVQVVGLDEILNGLRREHVTKWCDCAQLDNILQKISRTTLEPPIIELTSVGTGGGKTHLLYLLISLSVLTTQHGGQDGCVVIIDTDGNFSVHRLAEQIRHHLNTWASHLDKDSVNSIISSALHHVYIYTPQTMRGLVQVLSELPEYFLHSDHHSLDRSMSFIAIDSVSSFYWQTRAEEEDAAFLASVQSSGTSSVQSEQPTSYTDLRTAIELVNRTMRCPVIVTDRYQYRLPKTASRDLPRLLRPSLPSSFTAMPVTRFIVRRVPVMRFPSGLSSAELTRENNDRSKIVALARFECAVNEYGLNHKDVQALRASEDRFNFRITLEGLTIETSQVEQPL